MIAALTNHLWQSTLFAAVVALLAVALRRNRAGVRHALWLTASLKFLVPFSMLLSVGGALSSTFPATAAPLPAALAAAVDSVVTPFDDVFAAVELPQQETGPVALTSTPLILFAVWMAGCVSLLFLRASAWRRIRAAIRGSRPVDIGLDLPIAARFAPGLLEPGVVGVFKPVLLLPAGIEEALTPAQLAAVMAHELCHIRRRDNLTAVLHMTVETIFWFHPLVWWIGARLVDERERACDEHVLRTIDAPHVYAEGILGVCKRYLDSPIACVSGVSGGALRKRLEAIVVNRVGRQLSLTRRVVLTAAAAAALVLPLVAGMAPASLQATSQEQARKFDVASVKPCEQQPVPPGGRSGGGNGSFSPGRAHLNCFVVRNLIDQAYVHNRVNDPDDPLYAWTGLEGILGARPDGTGAQRIRGGPSWVYSDKYTIEATASGLDPSQPRNADRGVMLGPMLRALLEDRFKLKVHQDVEEVPMWALTVAKGGLKVKPITDEGCVTLDPAKDRMPTMDEEIAIMRRGGKPVCGHGVIGGKNGPNEALALGRQTMKGVARMLSVHTDRMILDKTGVEGRFNLYLEFAADDRFRDPLFFKPRGAEAAGPPTAPNVFTALQEQWGLKLEPAKGPRGYIVIDRIERPVPDGPTPGGARH